jgi:hypothetical protein
MGMNIDMRQIGRTMSKMVRTSHRDAVGINTGVGLRGEMGV